MKNITKVILMIIGVPVISFGASYLLFLGYNFLRGELTFLPEFSFWAFYLVLLFINIIFKTNKGGNKK